MASDSAKPDARHVAMALRMARALKRRLPDSVPVVDLEQAAVIGVLDAMRLHPNESGASFDLYVTCRVRGEILDELRRQDWSGRRNRSDRRRVAPPVIVRFDDLSERWGETFAGAADSPEERAISRCDAAKAWSTPMPARARRIMAARFAGNRRQHDIARDEGVSDARVSQLEHRALLAMKSHLTETRATEDVPLAERVAIWQARLSGVDES
jgi:RNA polymerase sigma factor (sigma-70 family)